MGNNHVFVFKNDTNQPVHIGMYYFSKLVCPHYFKLEAGKTSPPINVIPETIYDVRVTVFKGTNLEASKEVQFEAKENETVIQVSEMLDVGSVPYENISSTQYMVHKITNTLDDIPIIGHLKAAQHSIVGELDKAERSAIRATVASGTLASAILAPHTLGVAAATNFAKESILSILPQTWSVEEKLKANEDTSTVEAITGVITNLPEKVVRSTYPVVSNVVDTLQLLREVKDRLVTKPTKSFRKFKLQEEGNPKKNCRSHHRSRSMGSFEVLSHKRRNSTGGVSLRSPSISMTKPEENQDCRNSELILDLKKFEELDLWKCKPSDEAKDLEICSPSVSSGDGSVKFIDNEVSKILPASVSESSSNHGIEVGLSSNGGIVGKSYRSSDGKSLIKLFPQNTSPLPVPEIVSQPKGQTTVTNEMSTDMLCGKPALVNTDDDSIFHRVDFPSRHYPSQSESSLDIFKDPSGRIDRFHQLSASLGC